MGHSQHTAKSSPTASGCRRAGPRICLRKGCGCVFTTSRWNQRYCGNPECQRLVRRWQAAKRQRRRRQNEEHRQQHAQAQRERRQRCREATSASENHEPLPVEKECSPETTAEDGGAWSRRKNAPADFCDRPGCYDPVRASSRTNARYCGDDCRRAVRRVLDRERKWLKRKTYAGRFKRRLEYRQARSRVGSQQNREVRPGSADVAESVGNYSSTSDARLSYRGNKERPP